MERIDRLLKRAKPESTITERLKKDNPFLGKTDSELLDYVCPTSGKYRPIKTEWERYQWAYALMHSPHEPSELELEDKG